MSANKPRQPDAAQPAKTSPDPSSSGKVSSGTSSGGKPSAGRRVHSKDADMGMALRSIYQKTVDESVPSEMLDLLGKLG